MDMTIEQIREYEAEINRLETRLTAMLVEIHEINAQLADDATPIEVVDRAVARYPELAGEHRRIHARISVLRELFSRG